MDGTSFLMLVVGIIAGLIVLVIGLAFWPVVLLGLIGGLIAGPLGAVIGGAVGLVLMFR